MIKKKLRIHLIAAARPNFMKIAPLYHALKAETWCEPVLVHTGQHYDANMSDDFFRDLRLPKPDYHLEVGSGTHAQQVAGVMVAYEGVCLGSSGLDGGGRRRQLHFGLCHGLRKVVDTGDSP